ncbi:DDE_Tnp_1_7 domain-containing protein [Trichonephila clavipes]|nr:DDE_Tnp_1_7 domain-containing protein [Trichonephila clavipes]
MFEKFPELVSLSPMEIFHKFIPTELLLHLANMTGLYAMQKGEDFSVDENHIRQFLGLLLFSGYHQVPGEDSYRSTQEGLSVPIVSTVMPRNKADAGIVTPTTCLKEEIA